ncbi:MAG: tripartite tricarboxylate transporter TctB family protein [Betaproteobacteria bacterium]
MPTIRHPKDFYSGLIFIAFGVGAIVIANNYSLGTAARMGPGYFPRILGMMLIVLGAALSLRALKLQGDPIAPWKWRPTLTVLGSVVLFGYIVNLAGLVVSTIILIVLSSWASTEFRLKESIIAGIALSVLVVTVFVIGLKLQLPIWPSFVH